MRLLYLQIYYPVFPIIYNIKALLLNSIIHTLFNMIKKIISFIVYTIFIF